MTGIDLERYVLVMYKNVSMHHSIIHLFYYHGVYYNPKSSLRKRAQEEVVPIPSIYNDALNELSMQLGWREKDLI